MAKIKVHEIAKEFDIKSSDVIARLNEMGIEGKTASSGLEEDQAEALRKKLSGKDKAEDAKKESAPAPAEKPVKTKADAAARPAGEKSAPKPPVKGAPAQAPGGGPVVIKKKKPIMLI